MTIGMIPGTPQVPIAWCRVCGHALYNVCGVQWQNGVFEHLCFDCYLWSDGVFEKYSDHDHDHAV